MGIMKNRKSTAIIILVVLFAASACVRFSNSDTQGQQVSIQITNTFPPPPTLTPEPTATETTAAVDVPISNNPTATDTASPTPTETATETAVAVAQAGDNILQPTSTVDFFSLTATQVIIEGTQTAEFPLTLTAAVLVGSTNTPFPTLVQTQIPGAIGTSPPILSGADCVHEVTIGQTLFQLSQYYLISVNDIATRNGIVNVNLISVGQRVIIPGCGTSGALPPPTSVPTATNTPFTFNTTTGTGGPGLGDPNANAAAAGQGGGVVNTGCVAQYTVQQYDNLFQISITYGVAAQSIANANGITNVNRINMGDVLCIPGQ